MLIIKIKYTYKAMKRFLVNYDTKWTNEYVTPKEFCYFKANTPIEKIVAKLEIKINHRLYIFQENYQNKSACFYFNRLYRNLISSYKGWQVRYREPGSKTDYHKINHQIGYKPRAKKQSLKRTVLTKTLRWTHELYPLIDQVVMKGADSCETIAKQLNKKMNQPRYQKFLKNFKTDFDSLEKTYKTCHQNISNLDCKTNEICQTFCHDLQNLVLYYKPMHSLIFKNYTLEASNVSDVLEEKKIVKTAKGWHVELLRVAPRDEK